MTPPRFVHGLRWWIVSLVFLATAINFVDRMVIAVLAPVITERLGLTNLEFAGIATWFLLAYTASQGISGKLYDRLGTRLGFTLSVLLWSFAEMGHAFATGLRSLSALRFLLGLGEAGNWPGAAKVIAEWFPVRERALGMGIFNCGVAFGSIVAPPLIVWLQIHFGWQATFLSTGVLGLGWLVLWRLFYQTPDRHPKLGPAERALILEGRASIHPVRAVRWRDLLRLRQTWAIVLARLLTDPGWWLYLTWLPLYLHNVRGFSLRQIGMFAWAPYVVAAAGSLTGGWLCGHSDRARLERRQSAPGRRDPGRGAHDSGHPRRACLQRRGGAGIYQRRHVRLPMLGRLGTDAAQRPLSRGRHRLGGGPERSRRGHRRDGFHHAHRIRGGPPAQLHADSGGRRAAALTGNRRLDPSRRHRGRRVAPAVLPPVLFGRAATHRRQDRRRYQTRYSPEPCGGILNVYPFSTVPRSFFSQRLRTAQVAGKPSSAQFTRMSRGA